MDRVSVPGLHATVEQARKIPATPGRQSAFVLSHGSMQLRLLHPGAVDTQTPHDRDELYVIVAGSAVLLLGAPRSPFTEPPLLDDARERIPAGPGDSILVPAGTPHHFEEMSGDFSAWMVFWGPEGGEVP